jgi:hypothetical protein
MMKRSLASALLCVALTLIATGCANRQWTRPGADAAAISRDLDDCRASSLGRAGSPVAPTGSSEAVTDRGRPAVMQPSAGSNERFLAEHEETRRCMAKRGYELR